MSKQWNWPVKNEVRRISFLPFAGKLYDLMIDLPGGQCRSPREARWQHVTKLDATYRLAENDHRPRQRKGWKHGQVYQEIEDNMHRLGFSRSQYTLFRGDLAQLDLEPDERVGILNCDLMTQPCGFDLEFLDRLPYANKAGVIVTFQNPATRGASAFMEAVHEVVQNSDSHVLRYFRQEYLRKQFGLTLDTKGDISRETLQETASNRKFLEWGETILACVAYGLRNHHFRLNKVITYSCHPESLTFRMTSVIVTDVYRREGNHQPSHRAPAPGRDKDVIDQIVLEDLERYFNHG